MISKLNTFEYSLPYQPVEIAFAAFANDPYSIFFDSSDLGHKDGRYSCILLRPVEVIEANCDKIRVREMCSKKPLLQDGVDCPFSLAQQRLKFYTDRIVSDTSKRSNSYPFTGGLAGLFGYDLARQLEDLPSGAKATNKAIPDIAVGIYLMGINFDHHARSAHIFVWAEGENAALKARDEIIDTLETYKNAAPSDQASACPPTQLKWQAQFGREEYISRIQKVQHYISDGDIFQANVSQQFCANLPDGFDAYQHYLRLRRISPAPFAAYMNLGDAAISSASPERFLRVDNSGLVESKPIKGTAARFIDDTAADQRSKDALLASEKDRAENIMITDLLRNDLSKCCEDDSIEVPNLCALESFAQVHHLVSTVRGKLRQDCDALDLLRGCFPGGSITGAPKIRAMEIIEELEQRRRHGYCGSLAWIGFDGAMDSSILIRTLFYEDGRVRFNAGGGITILSDATAEYDETLSKAKGLFDSFSADSKQT